MLQGTGWVAITSFQVVQICRGVQSANALEYFPVIFPLEESGKVHFDRADRYEMF